VLDMIQKFICDYQHGEAFQMPQDDEVEEWKSIILVQRLVY
jgi:hypothetical protein